VIILADVWSGYVWEKYYYNEPWPYNATNTGSNPGLSGMLSYRHGITPSFHSRMDTSNPFINTNPNASAYGQNTGLHAAALQGLVTQVYNAP